MFQFADTFTFDTTCTGGTCVGPPAQSVVADYTPQPDGTPIGLWRTDIANGPWTGSVITNGTAYLVGLPPALFGSGS